MNIQELEKIKQTTLEQNQLTPSHSSARLTVGMGTCAIKAGAESVLTSIKKKLQDTDKKIVTVPVGCNGMCSLEPIVEVKIPGKPIITYGKITPNKVERIVKEHLIGNKPVKEWVVSIRETMI